MNKTSALLVCMFLISYLNAMQEDKDIIPIISNHVNPRIAQFIQKMKSRQAYIEHYFAEIKKMRDERKREQSIS